MKNGSMMWTMPIVVPKKLLVIRSGRSISPASISQPLRMPLRWRITIQA